MQDFLRHTLIVNNSASRWLEALFRPGGGAIAQGFGFSYPSRLFLEPGFSHPTALPEVGQVPPSRLRAPRLWSHRCLAAAGVAVVSGLAVVMGVAARVTGMVCDLIASGVTCISGNAL